MKRNHLLLFSAGIVFLLNSCTDSKKSVADLDQSSAVDSAHVYSQEMPTEVILYSMISGLNVRDEAGKKGKVLGKLQYGQRTLFMNEESDYKERITMRGEEHFETWKKIRFSSGNGASAIEGWVYGGGMKEEGEVFKEIGDNVYKREISRLYADDFQSLLGFSPLKEHNHFNGKVLYSGELLYKRINNRYLLDGAFKTKAMNKAPVADYEGFFNNGKLDQVLTETRCCMNEKPDFKIQAQFKKGILKNASVVFEDEKLASRNIPIESGQTQIDFDIWHEKFSHLFIP